MLSIPFTLSFGDGIIAKFSMLNLGFFDFMDFIAEGIFLTIGALLMCLFVIKEWGFNKFKEEVNQGAKGKIRLYDWMKPYFCYILPIIFIIVCYCIVRMYV